MKKATPRAARELAALAGSGIDGAQLRVAVQAPLQRLVGAGPVFVASADPFTLLFTGAASTDIPSAATPRFLHNEFAQDDVVKFRHLAAAPRPSDTLFGRTGGRPAASARWRDVIEPLGWGDELRVALRDGGRTWGFLCLHRDSGDRPFDAEDRDRLELVLPQLTAAFRRTSLAATALRTPSARGPGVVLIDADGGLVGTTGSAGDWLAELAPSDDGRLPLPILGLAAQLQQAGSAPVLRVHGPRSGWIALHGGLLDGPGPARVAVVIEPASPQLALPLLAEAVALTPREVEITAAVLRGESTATIATGLHLSEYTVQTHLQSVFSKTGVHSRRELLGRYLSSP